MLKRLVITAAIGFTGIPVNALAWEAAIPSLKDQYENAKIEELTTYFQNEPYFAGKIVNIDMFGKKVTVDRTREPNTTPPGTPPPSAAGIGITDILNGLSAETKANVGIDVHRKWNDQGVLVEEKWGIVVGGEYKVKKEALAPVKEGKTTGEEQ